MDQKALLFLLKEASEPECPAERIIDIAISLKGQIKRDDSDDSDSINTRYEGMCLVFEALFNKTLDNNPGYLPKLFPVFALLCGDKEDDMLVAKIDWTVLSSL